MKKVLVIDDDPAILEAISIVLEGEGYSVKTVEDAQDAVSEVKNYRPDVIFLDLLLSGKEGTEIANEIKSDSRSKGIPVVLISAHPHAHDSARSCGADAFLAKPFDLDELLDAVRTHTS